MMLVRPRVIILVLAGACVCLFAWDRLARPSSSSARLLGADDLPDIVDGPADDDDELQLDAGDLPDHWRPDLQVDREPGQAAGYRVRPRPPEREADSNPHGLPIRLPQERMPQYRYTALPSTDDPWPARPEIAKVYFNEARVAEDPPVPEWPEPDELDQARKARGHLTAAQMVQFEDLEPPVPPADMGQRATLPRVQVEDNKETAAEAALRAKRRRWVERAIKHGWEGFKASAWGADEVTPVSNSSRNPFNGWGASIIDALDLFLMLGWDREYALARTHVRAVDFTVLSGSMSAYGAADHVSIPTFETCIRYLGGLLSAYDISGDELMLARAKELADWIMGSFGTKEGLPLGKYRLGYNHAGKTSGRIVLSEAGSMSLEYTRLAQLTGEPKYFAVVHRVTQFFDTGFAELAHPKGLLPALVSDSAKHLRGQYSMGGQADSYYEYLIKEHQLLGGGAAEYARMFGEALDGAALHLIADVQVVPDQHLLVIGENTWDRFTPTLTHLTCFAGAMFGLGAKLLKRPDELTKAERLTDACVWAYNVTKSGIAPESMTFYSPGDVDRYFESGTRGNRFLVPKSNPIVGVKRMNGEYKGRPETIESVFYMWRLTGDKKWQEKGWHMFQAFIEATAVPGGFAAIVHVARDPPMLADYCESFVFAETLKYYWLLFSDNDVYSLDEHVFNTEAHPFNLRSNKPARRFDVDAFQDVYDLYDEKDATGLPDKDRPVGRGTAYQKQFLVMEAARAAEEKDDIRPGFGFG